MNDKIMILVNEIVESIYDNIIEGPFTIDEIKNEYYEAIKENDASCLIGYLKILNKTDLVKKVQNICM